jgi:signal transduction histidine kinase
MMLFLVNDILDFAQSESKTMLLNIEDANIRDLL